MMEVKEIILPSINKFASNYVKDLSHMKDFFHYDLKEVKVYEKRYHDLMERSFNRKDLVQTIETYMKKFGLTSEIQNNIDRLKQNESVVVIGGQQAGLLTGPMYTIHKVISIIKLAKEQEITLQKPVIPVFWIAGEDHDLDEVNHVFVEKDGQYSKKTYANSFQSKAMISDVDVDQEAMKKWLKDVLDQFEETAHTKDIYSELHEYITRSTSITDFFSFIINKLFGHHGLLLVDSGDKNFRKMQSGFFETLIQQHKQINDSVRTQQSYIAKSGYTPIIAMDENNANLFYYENQERVLLEFDYKENIFRGKNSSLILTKEDLLAIAKKHPEKLSNNVVTRPLMQESLFPVLAFISGPGELAYWSELKKAFEHLRMQLPPIVPRMNLTILEKKVQKDLIDVNMDIYEALVLGAEKAKERFLATVEDDHITLLYHKTEQQFKQNHQLLSQAVLNVDKGLEPLLKKNADLIQKQLEFLLEKIQQSTLQKHSLTIDKFSRITNALRPNGGPQERTQNIYHYLNQYGPDFVDELLALDLEANAFHKIIVV